MSRWYHRLKNKLPDMPGLHTDNVDTLATMSTLAVPTLDILANISDFGAVDPIALEYLQGFEYVDGWTDPAIVGTVRNFDNNERTAFNEYIEILTSNKHNLTLRVAERTAIKFILKYQQGRRIVVC